MTIGLETFKFPAGARQTTAVDGEIPPTRTKTSLVREPNSGGR